MSDTPTTPRKRMGRPPRQARGDGPDAGTLLLQAATAEFVAHGFEGTSTNRIAERAGFAPQTFYRWYADKLAVFQAVLNAWAEAELSQLQALLDETGPSLHAAEACVASQHTFLIFLRSVQRLAQEHPAVRTTRAAIRQQRMALIQARHPQWAAEEVAHRLIVLDHLCQALAEGEFTDLGLRGDAAYAQLAALIDGLRGH